MKKLVLFMLLLTGQVGWSQPMRVAILEFEDLTGGSADALLGGTVPSEALAAKGVQLLGLRLVNDGAFTLVDRRDFFAQMEKLEPTDQGKPTPVKPSFLQAAQALRTDAVLRGNLLSFSTGKEVVEQGGHRTEFSTVAVRVSLQALDAVDGAVIAMTEGVAKQKFRQTDAQQTMLGEDDVLVMLGEAMANAVPDLKAALEKRRGPLANREKVLLTVKSTADPALVEVDGILVGTTPLAGFELYKGDHVLTVGKAGYYDITKRIMFDRDTEIEAPLFRFELSAEEQKEVLEKSRLHVFSGDEGLHPGFIINTSD